jgi:hypothetical protein
MPERSPRGLKTLLAWLLVAAVCAVLVWQIRFAPARPRGSVSVSFVGFTNNASGAVSAQFTISNGFPRQVVVAAGAVQIRQTKGWPAVSVYGHPAGPVFTVAPTGVQAFAISLPKVDGVEWRVPLHYETVETRVEQWTKRAKSALGVVKPVNPGMFTNTPEMFGVTGHSLEQTGASGLTQETNQVP